MTIEEREKALADIILKQGRKVAVGVTAVAIQESVARAGGDLPDHLLECIWFVANADIQKICLGVREKLLPPKLVELLAARSKKIAVRIAERELALSMKEFSDFILWADACGFSHARKHKEFVPDIAKQFDPKKFGDHDPETRILTKDGKKQFNVIKEVFKTRKQFSAHWFEEGSEWHCFYFDQHDLTEGHWMGGNHIHYVSHLWGLSADQVWANFDSRKNPTNHAHIKFSREI